MNTVFRTDIQAYIAFKTAPSVRIFEWAGPIPATGEKLRIADGDNIFHLDVTAIEWVCPLTGDIDGDAIVAPAEIYIHAKASDEATKLIEDEPQTPEFVSHVRAELPRDDI